MDSLSSGAASTIPAATPMPAALPKRRRFSKNLLAVLITLLVISLCFIAGVIKYGGTPTNPVGPPTGPRLNSIAMISPDEGWIAGAKPRSNPEKDAFGNADQNAFEPMILHYKGDRWAPDQLPSNINPYNLDMTLSSIAMVSSTEGWATGSTLLPSYPPTTINGRTSITIVDGITFPVLLHYTGGKWTLVDNAPAAFGSILMRPSDNGWAIGQARAPDNYGALALRYNGTTWNKMKDPAFASLILQTIAEAPDGEVWITAVDYSQPGPDGDAPAAVLHYDGSTWTREQISLANDRLLGLTMVSAHDGWAVGYDPGGTRAHQTGPQWGLIVHYHNGVWEQQNTFASPSGDTFFYLSAVTMVSANEGWAIGQEGVIVHYLDGAWASVQSPTTQALQSIAMVSPAEGWAVGTNGTILHYENGSWSPYRAG